MSSKMIGEWVSVAACVLIVGIAWGSLDLGPEPGPPNTDNLIEILNWNWKRDRSGNVLAVFGTVRNNTPETYGRVTLELRTEDEDKTVLARHAIEVGGVLAGAEKPFREDIPRTGSEAMGFLEVKRLGR
ncbi:MAG: hypothetical protein CME19_00120 [Gemmatimonadetes bacterium]|nr:hypothetical protein [Gemmatimonadota bacterium]